MASFCTTKFKLKITNHKFRGTCLIGNSLTDCWLHVVAADIVEPNAVVVEVVEDGQAELISLTVVRLGQSMTEKKSNCHVLIEWPLNCHLRYYYTF